MQFLQQDSLTTEWFRQAGDEINLPTLRVTRSLGPIILQPYLDIILVLTMKTPISKVCVANNLYGNLYAVAYTGEDF